ncbi:MAG: 2-C-methyl-D-erythritol 4-phosphate cytidylyltransferase [Thermomicrobiales bacterium]
MAAAYTTGAIIVAAGRGTRMGGADKCALPLRGRSLVSYSVEAFAPVVDAMVVVVAADCVAAWTATAAQEAWSHIATIVAGGETRQESVRAGFDALRTMRAVDAIAVHDGARPLISVETIRQCIAQGWLDGAAITAVPVTDTIKRVIDGRIVETLDRATLWAAQTPQAFRADLLHAAFAWADSLPHDPFTDEASLVEAFGRPVAIVRGDRANIKVTEPADLTIAEALLGAQAGAVHA